MHLVWTVVDATVWQPSVPQFSAPASLKVGRNTRDVSHDSGMEARPKCVVGLGDEF